MIHSELCSACGGPLQLGVGLVIIFTKLHFHSGSAFYENFGRKKSIIASSFITIASSFVGFFCNSYELLLLIRFSQGVDALVTSAAVYIWGSELVPARYRHLYNGYKV